MYLSVCVTLSSLINSCHRHPSRPRYSGTRAPFRTTGTHLGRPTITVIWPRRHKHRRRILSTGPQPPTPLRHSYAQLKGANYNYNHQPAARFRELIWSGPLTRPSMPMIPIIGGMLVLAINHLSHFHQFATLGNIWHHLSPSPSRVPCCEAGQLPFFSITLISLAVGMLRSPGFSRKWFIG